LDRIEDWSDLTYYKAIILIYMCIHTQNTTYRQTKQVKKSDVADGLNGYIFPGGDQLYIHFAVD